jgi:transcriptional regulator with XRE-family HTH domain
MIRVSETNALGAFLRARRGLITPQEVGLTSTAFRRVPGLRREELALLARISADYYLRLEQGRDNHPSPEILDALARALRLDEAGTTYLHQLAYPPMRPARAPEYDEVSPSLQRLIESWPANPAHVQAPDMTVLASNAVALAISHVYTPGTNGLRAAFLDLSLRDLYVDWRSMAERVVAGVRAATSPDDPQVAELVSELTEQSPEFVELWQRHDVHPQGHDVVQLNHPTVGRLDLSYEKFQVDGRGGQRLIVFQPEPGSEDALRKLAVQ